MSDRLKTKLQSLQREFELETERMATWLYDERKKQMKQKISQQAVSEDIEVDYDELNLGSNNNINDGFGRQDRGRGKSPQVTQPKRKSNQRPSSEKKSKSRNNFWTKINNPWKNKSSLKNGKLVTNKVNASSKIGKDEDFMTLFGDIERQISREKNISPQKNSTSNGNNHRFM